VGFRVYHQISKIPPRFKEMKSDTLWKFDISMENHHASKANQQIIYCLVVWNLFFLFPNGNNHPN
jgi:hypothetical protein